MVHFKEDGIYEIKVDVEKNRYSLVFTGVMNSPDDVPHYLDHMEKSLALLKTGFQAYVEILDDKPPKFSMTKILQKSQQMQVSSGLGRCAVYLVKGKILQKMTLSVVSRLSGLKEFKIFNNPEEAIAWLDAEYEI